MSIPSFFNSYERRLSRINTQFEFLRYAFKHLSKSKRQEFFRSKRKHWEETKASEFKVFLELPYAALGRRGIRAQAKHLYGPNELKLHENEILEDGLNRSELRKVKSASSPACLFSDTLRGDGARG